MLLGEILLESGKISSAQLTKALQEQSAESEHRRIGKILVDAGHLRDFDVVQALAQQYRAEAVEDVLPEMLDAQLIESLPVEWARSHEMLPISFHGRIAALTADPSRVGDQDDLSLLLGKELIPVLTTSGEIRRCIESCYFSRQDTASKFIEELPEAGTAAGRGESQAADLLRIPDDAPVTQLVNLILIEALKARASDVHVEPLESTLRIRYRIDGVMYSQAAPPKHMEGSLISRLKVMGNLDIAEKRLPQDGMARVRVGDREVDIRISTIPVAAGERVVLRLLDRDSALLPLGDLGMPKDVVAGFRDILGSGNGAIWVTGPTGSGKTTTLYAALQELDTDHRNVLTIEDPIEYQLPDIGQIAVKPKIGLTFAHGLRHILRQDPDVILVGETRDLETGEIAIRASLTGHLVFSTLHTNDAAGAVLRLLDMGIPPYLLSAATRAVVAQRLVRSLCDDCKEKATVSPEELRSLGPFGKRLESDAVWRPKGCQKCLGGYRGRTGIYELLLFSDEIREAIRAGATQGTIETLARESGMRLLAEDALDKVRSGQTSVTELLRAVGRTHHRA